jgi:hypothetical protein
MPRRVIKLRTSPKCAVCRAGDDVRDRVDSVLATIGGIDPSTGEKLTWGWAIAVIAHLVGREVSQTSLRRHIGRYGSASPHSQLVDEEDEETAEKLEERQAAIAEDASRLVGDIEDLLESGDGISASGVLDLQLKAWLVALRKKLLEGGEVPITSDLAQRAANTLIRAEKDAQTAAHLAALSGGLSAAFELAMSAPPGYERPRGMPEIVDHVPVAEEDVEDAEVVPPAPPPPPSRPVPPLLIEDAPAKAPVESSSEPPVEVVVEPVPSSTDERRGGYREKRDA